MAGLGRTIPALPVRDVTKAVEHYRDRFGFTALHIDEGFAVMERDAARVHLWRAASCRLETEDVDGVPLIEFFRRVRSPA